MREELKFVLMEFGEQFVIAIGLILKLALPAKHWVISHMV